MKKLADCPQILRDFLIYHETIKGQSQLTISEYHLDLRMFLRFVKLMRNDMPISTQLEDIPIKDIDVPFLSQITTSDVFDFLSYLANDRNPTPDSLAPEYGISSTARAAYCSIYITCGVLSGAGLCEAVMIRQRNVRSNVINRFIDR